MTSRRAIAQWDARLSRALQFIPGHVGGRVASAQPIRRRGGTLRRVSVAGTGAYSPATLSSNGGGIVSLATASATEIEMNSDAAADGRYAFMLATVPDETVSAPSGWTVLGSGTSGDISWVAAWTVVTGATDYTVTATGTGYDASTFSGNIVCLSRFYTVTGDAVPVLTVRTSAGGSRAPVYPDSVTLASGIAIVVGLDAVGYVEDPESGEAEITRPSTSWSFAGVTGGVGKRTHQMFRLTPIPTTKPVPDLFTSTETGTDWLAAGVGWASA